MAKRKNNQVTKQDVKDNLSAAVSAGGLSQGVNDLIVLNLNTSAVALQAVQGTDPGLLGSTEATIVALVVDTSLSMREVEGAVVESIGEFLEAMKESKGSEDITLSLITFNDRVMVSFANQTLDTIKRSDYEIHTDGRTALYDGIMDALTGALAFEEELLRTGRNTNVNICVLTDGANNASRYADAGTVRKVIAEMMHRENWNVGLVGFETFETRDNGVDYNQIAREAGIPAVITIDLTGDVYVRRHKIRETFRRVSKSIIRASKTKIQGSAAPQDFFAMI
jgi:Mg-chelatase subunit ChlD